jgi:phosphoribosylamine---glycine ligase
MSEKILIIGSGGREHAMALALAGSVHEPLIFAAPGNPGTAAVGTNISLDPRDRTAVAQYCLDQAIDLVIVGPEDPLIDGLADAVRSVGIPVFGPDALGARLEGDKHYAKEVMDAAGAPTAAYKHFDALQPALDYLQTAELPIVVKACGAAQGKGVAVCTEREDAEAFLKSCLDTGRFGAAGSHVLLETCLLGPELSVLVLTDGTDYALLAPSRDHKRAGEGDTGPNTGGMGAFATGALVPDGLGQEICRDIVEPVLAEIRKRGIDYKGVLYIGLMLTASGPQILEFNCRFGDPETQVVLPLLQCDFLELTRAVATGYLGVYLAEYAAMKTKASAKAPADWPGAVLTGWDNCAMVVVGAAEGYPGAYEKGRVLKVGRADDDQAWLVHAGTALDEQGRLVTGGGRVLGAVGRGTDFNEASERAYGLIDTIECDGLFCRRDIGAGFRT